MMLLLTSGRGTNGRLVSLAKLGIFNSQPLDLMSYVKKIKIKNHDESKDTR